MDGMGCVTHALRGEGFDASEDGTGRGTPLVPIAIQERAVSENPEAGPQGAGFRDDGMAYTLEARNKVQAVAFSCKDSGADVGSVAPTLRAMGHNGSHANAGGQLAIAFDTTQITSKANRSNPQAGDPSHPLAAGAHAPAIALGEVARTLSRRHDGSPCADRGPDIIGSGSAVRRLTPRECERLQGFPDDYTLISHRGKPAADGPRYKALGNSMAVPVMAWIGQRIQMVEEQAA
jgi:DNA (cytosine-5)-methyltransferase 1